MKRTLLTILAYALATYYWIETLNHLLDQQTRQAAQSGLIALTCLFLATALQKEDNP